RGSAKASGSQTRPNCKPGFLRWRYHNHFRQTWRPPSKRQIPAKEVSWYETKTEFLLSGTFNNLLFVYINCRLLRCFRFLPPCNKQYCDSDDQTRWCAVKVCVLHYVRKPTSLLACFP